MTVYVARHAWAGHYGDPAWPDDSRRPLTAEGVERYRRVVAALAERGFAPERVATSPYTRCVQTAELIAEATAAPLTELDALAVGADVDALIAWTDQAAAESVCWVGHPPAVERLTAWLIGDGAAGVRFAKGSVAAVDFVDRVAPGEGVLRWHATAKLLGM